MNSLIKTLGMALFGFAVAHSTLAQEQKSGQPNRIIIGTHVPMSKSELESVLKPHNATHDKVGNSQLHIVEVPDHVSRAAVADKLSKHPNIKFVEVDQKISVDLAVNDPYLGSQWHISKVNAPTAWDFSSGTGITIAILDTGVNSLHLDLAQNMVSGYNFYNSNTDTRDVYGHGTAVAGVAAAVFNNTQGVAGIAGNAKIMPVRISDPYGYAYLSTIAQGIIYAADHGARVVNVSFSGAYKSSAVISASDYLRSKNGLLFVSAGNSGTQDTYSGNTSVIAVSATDINDFKTSWSSYGPYVNLAAPGEGIWTTDRNGGYSAWSGTSFSSPLAAGVAALMMSVNPGLTASQVESALYKTAFDLTPTGKDIYYGYGRVDAYRAVTLAKSMATLDTVPPSVTINNPLAGSKVAGLVNVSVSINDNNSLTGSYASLTIDNYTVVKAYGLSSINYSWDTTSISTGAHTITVVAIDSSGNKTTNSITVYR